MWLKRKHIQKNSKCVIEFLISDFHYIFSRNNNNNITTIPLNAIPEIVLTIYANLYVLLIRFIYYVKIR